MNESKLIVPSSGRLGYFLRRYHIHSMEKNSVIFRHSPYKIGVFPLRNVDSEKEISGYLSVINCDVGTV